MNGENLKSAAVAVVLLSTMSVACSGGSSGTPSESEARPALEKFMRTAFLDKNKFTLESFKKTDGQLNGNSYLMVVDLKVKGCTSGDKGVLKICRNEGNSRLNVRFEKMESGWVAKDVSYP